MESSTGFGSSQLALSDLRLAFNVTNHLRLRALNRAFGVSHEQANVLTVILLLAAADSAGDAARRLKYRGISLRGSGPYAAAGAFALRGAALGVGGPGAREIPAYGRLMAFAVIGGAAAPGLQRASRRLRAAEQQLRRRRIGQYVTAREHARASTP